MPVTVELTLPWGRYHATPWDRSANEASVEWPPSPWRLLRALVSSWKVHCQDLDPETVEAVLSRLTDPPRYVLPPFSVAHTRHYLPGIKHRGRTSIDTAKTLDAFVVTERGATVLVQWPADLDDDQRLALGRLLGALGYLGRSESLISARLLDGDTDESLPWVATTDASAELTRLLAPAEQLDMAALMASPAGTRAARLRQPRSTRWLSYPAPHAETPSPHRSRRPSITSQPPVAVRFSITGNALPPKYAAVALGDILRSTALARFDPENMGRKSAILAGKDASGVRLQGAHEHAHYLSFSRHDSHQPGRNGRRQLDTMVVWAPAGFGEDELDALGSCRRLWAPAHRKVDGVTGRTLSLGVEAFGDIAQAAPEIVCPRGTSRWESLTPYALTHHRRGPIEDQLKADISAELSRRGLPQVRELELRRGDWSSFRRYRVGQSLRAARRAFGVQIELESALSGPLALGQLSHFGLGLFRPVDG